ncbi:MAG TPA: thiamine-phosphate kinase [Rhizomicrobium sp.]|nr:thiamine-phosphate kinase [Rhizomicrobium sp.]
MTNSGSERPGEFELIAELFAPLANAPGAFGLTDDAAIATPPSGHDLVVTADSLVEGVHFFTTDPPELIARKALRVNLSDLAAKGCAPSGYLVTLSLPSRIDARWLRAFANGLAPDQTAFGISLLGGDTTATPGPLSIAITAFGHVPQGKLLRRAGARPGDLVFVSGTLGDAGGGLACLKQEACSSNAIDRAYLVDRFQVPQPRIALGQALVGVASASIDVSDGLVADLGHIAESSSVHVGIEAARIPLSPELKALWGTSQGAILRAATAGDDYEIAFAVPPENCELVRRAAIGSGVSVTEIGRCEAGQGVILVDEKEREIPVTRPGYVHF